MLRRPALALIAIFSSIAASLATGEIEDLITDADRERLAAFDRAKQQALGEAENADSRTALAALRKAAEADPLPFSDFDMTGNWQCRTLKAGGLAKLAVYGWFDCRVTDDGSGWRLEKLSGSQRTVGRFFTESDTRLTYLGAFFVADDAAPEYGAGIDSDQVGYAVRTGAESWQIEFPLPRYESTFDILEFRR
ncbi:MAG: DUF4893 domain-containing protein [Aliihoeflea sp.]